MRVVTLPRQMLGDELPKGPTELARVCEEQIAELESLKASALGRAERRVVNKQLHALKIVLEWCKTRAGYVNPMTEYQGDADG